jgi:hypothetical protein
MSIEQPAGRVDKTNYSPGHNGKRSVPGQATANSPVGLRGLG